MEYKFFTEDEANYIPEIYKGTNTINKSKFEEEFFKLHYDELIKERIGEELRKNAEKKKNLTNNEFLQIKVKELNNGIRCIASKENSEIDNKKKELLDFLDLNYGIVKTNNYIRLLSYILFSINQQRIDNIEKLNLFIDELSEILNLKDLRNRYIEFYEYLRSEELKKKKKRWRYKKIDSLSNSIKNWNIKYQLDDFIRFDFFDKIDTLKEEGKIISLLKDEKKEIFKIWKNCIEEDEDFYAIINSIKKYCDSIDKDCIMALSSIYIKNQFHYLCQYPDYNANYGHIIKNEYFYRDELLDFIVKRIKYNYNGNIKNIVKIEDNIINMLNILDDNTDNTSNFYDLFTADEQDFETFNKLNIDTIIKYNNYTAKLEDVINKEIEKINPQNQNKEYVNFEYLIKDKEKNITEIHNLATEKDVLDCNIIDFMQAIKDADFSSLNIKKLAKNKFLIYRLSIILNDKWYTQICKNMNFTKKECSGATMSLDDYFRKQIIKLTTK